MNIGKATTIEVCAVIIGLFAVTASLVASIRCDDPSWFARSGSLMVLCGVIAEYSNLRVQQFINQRATRGAGTIAGGVGSLLQSAFRRNLSYFTHIEVIIGTLIWGYGDLYIHLLE